MAAQHYLQNTDTSEYRTLYLHHEEDGDWKVQRLCNDQDNHTRKPANPLSQGVHAPKQETMRYDMAPEYQMIGGSTQLYLVPFEHTATKVSTAGFQH